ncbi:protein mono-ADP-ribosyltransferase PARP9 [Epinephelus moara]|uniref:protein mono-ADP-ribosyltransferase PARP9 n=1 Tax=Epinephelus moara TaxID=300413 RepID=UPI00214DF67E|nr:protein mono-ADP-ribosyltransferase PARP9 [Epinephelus moara]XP_049903951.1 protein mono-ADP-ribosyltransferase PARP9 [Epinephelus moara]
MVSKLDIPLHGTAVNIVRRCGFALSGVLQSKFGCLAIIDGVDFDRDPSIAQQSGPTIVPEKRFSVTLRGGVQVSVWKADLINYRVDAVVNAANEYLQHYGGLALALSKAGGPQIQKDSEEYIKRHGSLKTGDAVVFDAGFLPCKKIIHAVGPQLPPDPSERDVMRYEPLLERAIRSILNGVQGHRLQSVAIPAISSGLFHYPLPKCAETIVTAVKCYCENTYSPHLLPKEIHFVNHDEPTVKEMERACHQILATSKRRGDAKTPTQSVQLGNVHLTLKRGKIEDQQTDVIVNTASDKPDLNIGQISKALLQKAGQKMQEEFKKAPRQGHVIVTQAYQLQCKKVFHTFCVEKGIDPAHQAAAQLILFNSVLECLWLAGTSRHKSIAFPAIGTGALGFNKKEVADIMSRAVVDFAQKFPEKIEVDFVIYPSDNDTFKAFEEHMGYLQQKASHAMMLSSPASEDRADFHVSRSPTPQISLNGASNETTREAEQWLSRLLFRSNGKVVICNNFILHFGEEQHLQLSRLLKSGVSIEEVFEKGHASILVKGDSDEDVVVAGLQVEAMLCNVQKAFVKEECAMLPAVMTKSLSFERKTVDNSNEAFLDRLSGHRKHGLFIVKVDRVENPTLKKLFELKKKQLSCSTPPRTMVQRIPAQFCEMVSHIGFHAEYAPPDDPSFGEGIYFASKVKIAMEVWKEHKRPKEEYLYFVEAEVLTGNPAPGKPGLILPPAVGTESQTVYHSVSGGPDISVIFSGYQALPTYIITCKMC